MPKNVWLADVMWSHVAATTLMAHCVWQIATASQSNGNISLVVAFLFAKQAKLNLKELSTLRSKKKQKQKTKKKTTTVHWIQLPLFFED